MSIRKPSPATSSNQSRNVEAQMDTLDTEYNYYRALLQELIPALHNPDEQEHANRWLTRLTDLSLNVKNLRDKRNRFLMMLCLCLFTGHVQTPFDSPPPAKLPELSTMKKPKFSPAEWHTAAGEWKEHLALMNELLKKLKLPAPRKCSVHPKLCSGGKDARGTFLDRQFEFFLHLARSYLRSLNTYPDSRIACRWIEALSQIDQNCCIRTKGIRNDYMLFLMGYLLQHRLLGPFCRLPVLPLEELMDGARKAAESEPLIKVNTPEVNREHDFLKHFPLPEEGVFAFISLSSDYLKSIQE
ncbi:uncharacterized protein LOC129771571 [Toxorhynchites rutilus septentrionalis]|uniref:uncharacterized protein LOC129771571 n=1 Tax=Toxorhynchites rutilus septentrionalis TaxID=329112 RepID=UPI002478684C|nr:uncharacterized protein LOC129771571 [Toxorhynchites rutilus septentrionalis]